MSRDGAGKYYIVLTLGWELEKKFGGAIEMAQNEVKGFS